MELDDLNLKKTWHLQSGGAGEAHRLDAERTVLRMQRARTGQRLVLGACTVMTIACTGFIGVTLQRHGSLDWRSIWPVALVQAVSILTLGAILRMRLNTQQGYERCGASVKDALIGALADIRRQVREMKLLAAGALVMTPLLAFQVEKLFESGKMNAHAVESLSALFALVLTVNGLVFAHRFYKTLRPERRRLGAILSEL